ncbi:SHOCT domain-containing protein [Gudongella sp. DL1XJH-153]|uniref:SHOCT domain-containing protein n=1 Tax=Gudongella sp. DL1XJH-153 TaxID=3409804 RepID=UPI003BB4C9ED
MSGNEDKIRESLESILEVTSFEALIKKSGDRKIFSSSNFLISLIVVAFITPIIILIGLSSDTILRFITVVEISKTISISLFGIAFTGYALFQAFVSGELLERLLIHKGEEKSVFEEYNLFFFRICFLYLILILINYIVLIILKNIPSNYTLQPLSYMTNSIVSIILIFIYLLIHIFSLVEMKSFLYNIYQAFNFNALNEGVKIVDNNKHINTISIADEIKKSKSLLDQGIISQDEFNKIRKDLLKL